MSIDKKKCRASVVADASGGGVGASSNWYNIHRALYSVKSGTADKVTADFVSALYSNPHLTGGLQGVYRGFCVRFVTFCVF